MGGSGKSRVIWTAAVVVLIALSAATVAQPAPMPAKHRRVRRKRRHRLRARFRRSRRRPSSPVSSTSSGLVGQLGDFNAKMTAPRTARRLQQAAEPSGQGARGDRGCAQGRGGSHQGRRDRADEAAGGFSRSTSAVRWRPTAPPTAARRRPVSAAPRAFRRATADISTSQKCPPAVMMSGRNPRRASAGEPSS